LGRLALVVDATAPQLLVGNMPIAHYDAVIPRPSAGDTNFGAAVVRQFEIRGSFALNSGDALDRLLNPLATRQRLAARSVPIPVETFATDTPSKRKATPFASIYRFLVVGGDIAAVVERRLGRELDASERPLPEERAIAIAAAEALDLRLASIDIGEIGRASGRERGSTARAGRAVA